MYAESIVLSIICNNFNKMIGDKIQRGNDLPNDFPEILDRSEEIGVV